VSKPAVLNVSPFGRMKKEECVKILRLFNELKPAVSNVSTYGRMVNKAGSLRAQRQQRRAQCRFLRMCKNPTDF
jgi:hypothetical protein